MRRTLEIDEEALAGAMKYATGRTKTEVINEALRSFVRPKRRKELLDWRGKATWTGYGDPLRKRAVESSACLDDVAPALDHYDVLLEACMQTMSVTSKGQVTIPKEIRRRLGIRAGSRVEFTVVGDHVELRPVRASAPASSSGFGMIRSSRPAVPPSFDVAELIREG